MMEMLCPECMGPLVTIDGKYARCSLHGGQYKILFTRWQSSENAANTQQQEVSVFKPTSAPAVSITEQTKATSDTHDIVIINCPQCGNPCRLKAQYVGKKAQCPNCNSVFSVVRIVAKKFKSYPMQKAQKSDDKSGTNLVCIQHPHVQAEYTCSLCNIPICETCKFIASDGRHLCPKCAIQNSQVRPEPLDRSKSGIPDVLNMQNRVRSSKYPHIYCRCGKRMTPVFEDDGPIPRNNVLLTCDDYILGCKDHDSLLLGEITEEEANIIEQERRKEDHTYSLGLEHASKNNDWRCPLCNEVNDGYLLKCICGYERDLYKTCKIPPSNSKQLFPDSAQNSQVRSKPLSPSKSDIPISSQTPRTSHGLMCREHVNVPAVHICKVCGAGMCETCDFVFPGNVHLCPQCVAKPKQGLTEKRKKNLMWSFILAVWNTFGLLLMMSGALGVFVRRKEDLEILGILIFIFILLPSIIGTALGFSTFEKRFSNPLSVWVASIWNAIILVILILINIIGILV